MKTPLQIYSHDFPLTPAIEEKIHHKAEKLEHLCSEIIKCLVTINTVNKHQHQGRLYTVHIELKVPNQTLAVSHQPHEDLYVAIRDAFDVMIRKLEEYNDIRRGE